MNIPQKNLITLIADVEDEGKRIDKFIADNSPGISRTRISNLILTGNIICNQSAILSKTYKIKENDNFLINLPEPSNPNPQPENIPLNIVFEDNDLIVIDKPAGLVVHPGSGNHSGTLVNALISYCGDSLSGIGGVKRPGIVHRLDKDTSGIMVVAKNDLAHNHLSKQFADHGRNGLLKRSYLAFVWGIPDKTSDTINIAIQRHKTDRTKMAIVKANNQKGTFAITSYRIEEKYLNKKNDPIASLVRCKLYTGRTHQIRVHMAHIGTPVINDIKYGNGFKTKMNKLPESSQLIIQQSKRQALHAELLEFEHPTTNNLMSFSSALPKELKNMKNMLSKI
ncbi:MAG: RluA family pseudouridine synthase [Alphaproteobacteria bacterium]|jgi:23S rRNA pseudouridine1911/1915/1917 synthase|tara:strand:+ start:66961 stop:67974 length:1014 start_codon:yes stop_codon:yes gene_type:complete